ncbi:MAG: hypothetical protein K1X72_12935 [Pyrinomonadaceae bacterium]|nr:hypothetical protein [Pyrinomonadaceae bacterium]
MLRIFFDHDLNHKIIKGLTKRISDLDYITPLTLGNIDESDANHLKWAWENRRVTISHDVNTMTDAANQRFANGESIWGLILVPQSLPIGDVIEELMFIISCSDENDFENLIVFLPFL